MLFLLDVDLLLIDCRLEDFVGVLLEDFGAREGLRSPVSGDAEAVGEDEECDEPSDS